MWGGARPLDTRFFVMSDKSIDGDTDIYVGVISRIRAKKAGEFSTLSDK